jgi:hypothetical protein
VGGEGCHRRNSGGVGGGEGGVRWQCDRRRHHVGRWISHYVRSIHPRCVRMKNVDV